MRWDPRLTKRGSPGSPVIGGIAGDTDMALPILRPSSAAQTDKFYAHLVAAKAHQAVNNAGALVPRTKGSAHTVRTPGGEKEETPLPAEAGNDV